MCWLCQRKWKMCLGLPKTLLRQARIIDIFLGISCPTTEKDTSSEPANSYLANILYITASFYIQFIFNKMFNSSPALRKLQPGWIVS